MKTILICGLIIVSFYTSVAQIWQSRVLYPYSCRAFHLSDDGTVLISAGRVINNTWTMLDVVEYQGTTFRTLSIPEFGWPSQPDAMPDLTTGGSLIRTATGDVVVAGNNNIVMMFDAQLQRWSKLEYVYDPNDQFEDSLVHKRQYLWLGVTGHGDVWISARTRTISERGVYNGTVYEIVKEEYVEIFRIAGNRIELVARIPFSNPSPLGIKGGECSNFYRDKNGDLWCSIVKGTNVSLLHIYSNGQVEGIPFQTTDTYLVREGMLTFVGDDSGVFYQVVGGPYLNGGAAYILRFDSHTRELTRYGPISPESSYIPQSIAGVGSGLWCNGETFAFTLPRYTFVTGRLNSPETAHVEEPSLPSLYPSGYSLWLNPNHVLLSLSDGLYELERISLSTPEDVAGTLSLYPHPIKRGMNGVLVGPIPNGGHAQILDVLGRTVGTFLLDPTQPSVPTATFGAGSYTLLIHTADGNLYRTRFIIVD